MQEHLQKVQDLLGAQVYCYQLEKKEKNELKKTIKKA